MIFPKLVRSLWSPSWVIRQAAARSLARNYRWRGWPFLWLRRKDLAVRNACKQVRG